MWKLFEKDYYPFGMMMPGRTYSAATGYRYGFNGKENDNEVKGEGNEVDYGMRIYDTRLGRFLSMDPLTHSYPFYSPYHYAINNPIVYIDIDGLQNAPSGVRAEIPVIRVELSNTYVGRNGALRTGPGYSIGTLPANSANLPAQTRYINQQELENMIPPNCTGFSIDPDGKSALVSNPHGSWRISLIKQASATNIDIKYPTSEELKKWYPQIFATHEQVTNDPSKLTNEQLQQSYERISQGKGTALDWQYKAEIDRRLAAGTLPIQQKSETLGITNINSFMASATQESKNGLTVVGRALQKHAGREGSSFADIKFSGKTGNEQALKVMNEILNSEDKLVEKLDNGTTNIFDKKTGRGINVSRNGTFNGFRDMKLKQ